jgi:GH15 family glucan-1,4-alpha-glucosidase
MAMVSEPIYRQSQRVILENQQPGGGYLACPTMPDYQFSWFRDGAFIAYAMALQSKHHSIAHSSGMDAQRDSATRFHHWCVRMILPRQAALERCIARAQRGEPVVLADTLNARYTVAGDEGPGEWPEFQLDGPGLWIWSLSAFVEITDLRPLPAAWAQAVDLTARYLAAMWQTPCNDCWEERGTEVHISTLAAIYTGLSAAERLLPDVSYAATREAIRSFVLSNGLTPGGELAKSAGLDLVDANLLLAALPDGGMFSPDDPLIQRTVVRIERELLARGHGVHRHVEDTYYGGGAWVLLGLWLAWHYTRIGRTEAARQLLGWAEAHADAQGNLPEQVRDAMFDPSYYPKWVEWRGEIANPLLWTHAKYLIVAHALGEVPAPELTRLHIR